MERLSMYQSNSKETCWMISLGLFPVPKVSTEPAYINMGFTEVQKAPIRKEREAEVKKASRAEGRVMRKKMMDELCLLLKTQNIQCRQSISCSTSLSFVLAVHIIFSKVSKTMTSDDFPAMIYSGTGVFGSVKNTVIRISLTNIIGVTGVMGPV